MLGLWLGDQVIDPKTRLMMNLSMIGALGKMHEWEIHCRGALNNGVSKEEIRAIIQVVGIYCGVPQALECFRVARKVLAEAGQLSPVPVPKIEIPGPRAGFLMSAQIRYRNSIRCMITLHFTCRESLPGVLPDQAVTY